jgi:hypothetical protein
VFTVRGASTFAASDGSRFHPVQRTYAGMEADKGRDRPACVQVSNNVENSGSRTPRGRYALTRRAIAAM